MILIVKINFIGNIFKKVTFSYNFLLKTLKKVISIKIYGCKIFSFKKIFEGE